MELLHKHTLLSLQTAIQKREEISWGSWFESSWDGKRCVTCAVGALVVDLYPEVLQDEEAINEMLTDYILCLEPNERWVSFLERKLPELVNLNRHTLSTVSDFSEKVSDQADRKQEVLDFIGDELAKIAEWESSCSPNKEEHERIQREKKVTPHEHAPGEEHEWTPPAAPDKELIEA